MNLKIILSAFVTTLVFVTNAYSQACPANHCSQRTAVINSICDKIAAATHQPKANIQAPFLMQDGAECSCPCSCYAFGTQVTTSTGNVAVEDITGGNLVKTSAGETEVAYTTSSDVKDFPVVKVSFSNGKTLTLSTNHALIAEGYQVMSADSVTVGTKILDQAKEPVTVTKVEPAKYTGGLANIIMKANRDDGEDRVVVSEGILSGDWKVQSHRDYMKKNAALREVIANIKK